MKLKNLFIADRPSINEEWLDNHPSFCMMPFVHLHVTQHGTVTPCCQAPWEKSQSFGNLNDQSIEEIWQGERINTFRKKMINGERDARCERCYEKEASGWKTLREITNKNYKHHLNRVQQTDKDGSMNDAPPVYYDLRFSNVCNYRCRICGPWSSSKWHKDAKSLGMTESDSSLTHATQEPADMLRQFEANIDSVEELYFAGGEPLIMDEHYQVLELLIKYGKRHVRLMYNTNFSTFHHKHWSVLELWQHFDHVNVAASLDAMETRAEFLRKEQNWMQILENLSTMRAEASHVKFMISPTVYALNVQHLASFHRYMVESGYIAVEDFVPSLLMQPEYYNIRCLPTDVKQRLSKDLKQHIQWITKHNAAHDEQKEYVLQTYRNLLDHLNHADHSHLLPELRKRCEALDLLRKENTRITFPELAFLFNTA